jgi:hypothetical protein
MTAGLLEAMLQNPLIVAVQSVQYQDRLLSRVEWMTPISLQLCGTKAWAKQVELLGFGLRLDLRLVGACRGLPAMVELSAAGLGLYGSQLAAGSLVIIRSGHWDEDQLAPAQFSYDTSLMRTSICSGSEASISLQSAHPSPSFQISGSATKASA